MKVFRNKAVTVLDMVSSLWSSEKIGLVFLRG